MKRSLAFLFLTLILTSCGSTDNRAKDYAYAMAETTCLLFDESVAAEDIDSLTTEIFDRYNVEDPSDIQAYLDEIAGTEALNEVAVNVRTHLEETCNEALEASGLTAAEMAEAIVLE